MGREEVFLEILGTKGGIEVACRRGKCLTFCWGYSIFPCNVLMNRLGAECRLVLRRVSEFLN